MSDRECSQCGVSALGFSWGFALLARDGWSLTTNPTPAGSAERTWLCPECASRADSASRGLATIFAARPPPQAVRTSRPAKVLVVDDQVLMLRCTMRLLQEFDTVVADSADKGLALLRSGIQFDVVICDVMMPGMTGPELYVRACQLMPALARRFVFMSADPATARAMVDQAAARVGVTEPPPLLPKPSSRAVLAAAVSAIAAGVAHEMGTYVLHRVPSHVAAERNRPHARRSSVPATMQEQRTTRGSQDSSF